MLVSPNLNKVTINCRIFLMIFTIIAKLPKQGVCSAAYAKAVCSYLAARKMRLCGTSTQAKKEEATCRQLGY